MASSDGELQELRRLVAELTARVFRLERELNLQRGSAVEAGRPPKASPLLPPKPAPAVRMLHPRRCQFRRHKSASAKTE